jgi:hypothetical protein
MLFLFIFITIIIKANIEACQVVKKLLIISQKKINLISKCHYV